MKHQIAILLPLCLLISAISSTRVFVVNAFDGYSSEFMELVSVNVNCTTADVYTSSMVMSSNASLVHFPEGVDMNRTELENATMVALSFSTAQSFLIYIFNNTDLAIAQSLADAVKPSIETAFGTSFTWNSTGKSNSQVNVTYVGSGITNLTQYTESLMSLCLASDLGGFSLTFLTMTNEASASTVVVADKESGGFEWEYSMMVSYSSSISMGVGSHKIDILDLLEVSSLSPSPYANVSTPSPHYSSTVYLQIWSNETYSFVSCEPDLASPPSSLRGWYVSWYGWRLVAYFSFADDPTWVSPLTLTFSGNVLPEFTTLALITTLTLVITITLVVKKQTKKL